MDSENLTIAKEISDVVEMFDCMDGQRQLEFMGILLEKMENGEIELDGKPVTPEEVGIDDAFASCAIIMDLVYNE
jgi:hypothetical protein